MKKQETHDTLTSQIGSILLECNLRSKSLCMHFGCM
jgi:hypothetical protein